MNGENFFSRLLESSIIVGFASLVSVLRFMALGTGTERISV